MSLPHRKGWATAEEARHSKAFLSAPGAELDDKCPCKLVHVRKPAEPARLALPQPRRVPVRSTSPAKAPRDTGPSPAIRRLVRKRDGGQCAGCGVNVTGIPFSIQHIIARGMGGTSRPDANSPGHLVLLCGSANTPGSCHLLCEQRDTEMHRRGLWLNSWESAAGRPVGYATPDGLAWFLLNPDGSRTAVDESEVTAA